MSETLTALRQMEPWIVAFERVAPPRQQSECVIEAERQHLENVPSLPSGDVLERIYLDSQHACATVGSAEIHRRMLRNVPLVLWHGTSQAAAIPTLLDEFLSRTFDSSEPRASWFKALIEAWLRDFGPDRIRHSEIGSLISTMLPRFADHPQLRAWGRADRDFALFDVTRGPRQVAKAFFVATTPLGDFLSSIGMNDPLRAAGRFFRATNLAAIDSLPQVLCSDGGNHCWMRFQSLSEVDVFPADARLRSLPVRRLRFLDLGGKIATRTLEPWKPGPNAAPCAVPRKDVLNFLVRHLGDPRVHPQKWTDVEPWAVKLVRTWLSEESLEAFLSLISKNNDDAQWKYRKAFWLACRKKVPNDFEAWVILGTNLAHKAGSLSGFNGSFGRVNIPDQAVLLLRLGNLIFSEWSNLGPVRAWEMSDSRCPPMKPQEYTKSSLQATCLDFPYINGKGGSNDGKGLWHRQPENGLWQSCAAELLRRRLGVSLTWADYKL